MFQRAEAAFKLYLHPSKSRLMSNVRPCQQFAQANTTIFFLIEAYIKTFATLLKFRVGRRRPGSRYPAATRSNGCSVLALRSCFHITGALIWNSYSCFWLLMDAFTQAVTATAIKGGRAMKIAAAGVWVEKKPAIMRQLWGRKTWWQRKL